MLLTKTVSMTWTASNKGMYEESGYYFTFMGDTFELEVEDLSIHSSIRVDIQCDYCKDVFQKSFKSYSLFGDREKVNKDACDKCRCIKNHEKFLCDYGFDVTNKVVEYLVSNKKKKTGCVYRIKNKTSGLCYVGSTTDLLTRWKGHIYDLESKTHRSPKLQIDFDTFGKNIFDWDILLFSDDKSELLRLENYYIEEFDSKISGYNTVSSIGLVKDKRVMPEEMRQLLRSIRINNKNTNNKLEERDVVEIKRLLSEGWSSRTIAQKFNVSDSTVGDIKRQRTWTHIKTEYDSFVKDKPANRNGSLNSCSKLTESDVAIIKERIRNGESNSQIAKDFNVTRTLIYRIKMGKIWNSVA